MEKSDIKEFKIALFENSNPEEFLFFMSNFKMTFEASGTLTSNARLQCLHTLLHGETRNQFDTLCVQVESTGMTHLNRVVLGLGTYFTPVN